MPDIPYLALTGPTASGKTAAALAIARQHPVEIVSVDSAQVYRGMDIGTAKPTAEERALVVHHLLDIRDPTDPYSAAEFVADARRLIADIRQRNKLPLLVGGTMLYLKALRDGLDDIPSADPALRTRIQAQAADLGWPALHAELARVDPVTAARLAPNDSQRIGRALEVYQASGRPLSSFHGQSKQDAQPLPGMVLVSLEPRNREWLHHRIAQRFDQMLAGGLLEEVQALRSCSGIHADLPAMRCVGYRQAWQALDGAIPMAALRDQGIHATRQLAKRQLTWLRSWPDRHVVACDADDGGDAVERVCALAGRFLGER
ncbi:tRNA (adenosine(37)-N6)-dimethylallyltransferase MiaA [Candidatus Symbiobacter mobilis]|uniref:tRNA dimethylallyltransferase n=1 Tax=Candidatus Symbiobacter mobilis CR TaxID=946483 RepID=U5N6R9_9BURK|nr:tRNA (adenosine(37)-N6)-dimethylallyltransferase MiaA [Candidatus Symbiobacter mobilis]AGX87236.1 tRNA dimethylallyltransferase [Candidatus Symbiobacter mobilis CR]